MDYILYLYFLYNLVNLFDKKLCSNCKNCVIVRQPKDIFVEKCFLFKNESTKEMLLAKYCKENKKFCGGLFYNQKNY